ncbi:sulfatase-like hydrolase/transferase [Saliphagus infecundisoli]|uniref:Sulfatase-like hydrolase/transferase n=1 Tax=Saliphagus infecundisoli TaxID=1849069 RepID=A0ABD5QAK8_9EURY|nr:sulfatase-like hydrolase/transferase [Saliphagus infecundisoli]
MADRPNVLLITTDQHRGSAIGADPASPRDAHGDPLVHTPTLDSLVGEGAMFTRAYTPAPSSIPARRCLWTGRRPANVDATTYHGRPWTFEPTLAGLLREAGYRTRLTGKTHAIPAGNRIGFEETVLHAGLSGREDDYSRWLAREREGADEIGHGVGRNSWDARPWHLDEQAHPTVWTTDRAIEFLDDRDPTRPFFHYVSYVRPHQPYDPPRAAWEHYDGREIPDPPVGDWARGIYGDRVPAYPSTNAWLADLPREVVHRARVGYYGSVTHVDRQIGRLLRAADLENTLVIFASDHGDMLGDHGLWRKTFAYEGSARVPLIVRPPDRVERPRGREVPRPVGLEDLLPTILEAAGVEVPGSVDGRSLWPLMEGDAEWRSHYHGEHGPTYDPKTGTQFLVSEDAKYVWHPTTGDELLFDLADDPLETRNLAGERSEELPTWRDRLVDRLAGRPEGFTDGDRLLPVEAGEAWNPTGSS